MAGRILAAIALVLLGSFLGLPVAILGGVVVLLLEVVHLAWARRGLRGITYARRLETARVPFGEPLRVEIEVWNRSALPVAWLRADDAVPAGLDVRERAIDESDGDEGETGVLRNAWTLRPWERVRRGFHLSATRRGVYGLGPVDLSIGDPFARRVAGTTLDLVDRFLVWPRTVPVRGLDTPDRWGELDRARTSLTEDPSRFAGVRPYTPGDPLRRVHHRASARMGEPVTKRFDASRDREVLVVLDAQAGEGMAWEAGWDDDELEALLCVTGSLALALGRRHIPFGLMAAAHTGTGTRIARLPASAAPGHAERALDLLARMSGHATMPFDRLLALAGREARPGATVLAVTARDASPVLAALRRLEQARDVQVVLLGTGRRGEASVPLARDAGVAARRLVLDGSWRTAGSVVVAR